MDKELRLKIRDMRTQWAMLMQDKRTVEAELLLIEIDKIMREDKRGNDKI